MKRIKRLLPVLLCLCVLTACAKSTDTKEGSTLSEKQKQCLSDRSLSELEELAEELASDITYDFELSSVVTEEGFPVYFMEVPTNAKGFLYTSTTSSGEMVAVILLESEEDAIAMEEQLNSYMDDEYSEFKKYEPEEAKKLEQRIVLRSGNAVVASVSPSPKEAESIINKYLEDR